jgi:hypothetical protein
VLDLGDCPNCECDHLHLDLIVKPGGHFEVVGQHGRGVIEVVEHEDVPSNEVYAEVSCCACDWTDEREVRLVLR